MGDIVLCRPALNLSSRQDFTKRRVQRRMVTSVSGSAVHARAIAALVLAVLSAPWLILGAYLLQGLGWRTWIGIAAATASIAHASTVTLRMPHTDPYPTTPDADPAGVAHPYLIVALVELALILGVRWALRRRGRGDLVLPAIALIVGLHFFPLALVFHEPRFEVTGGVIVLATLASLLVRDRNAGTGIACLACGTTLWLTAVALLFFS